MDNEIELNDDEELRELEVDLTAEEIEERSRRLPEIVGELEGIEAAKAAAMAGYNADLKDKRKEMRAVAGTLRSGTEKRQVVCRERQDFERNAVEVVRIDTSEVIETRPMEGHERQQQIAYPPGGNGVAHYPPGASAPAAGEEGNLAERVYAHLCRSDCAMTAEAIADAFDADLPTVRAILEAMFERGAVQREHGDKYLAIVAAPEPQLTTKKKRGRPRKAQPTETVQ